MSSDSEDDYMADTFVSAPAAATNRPGLVHSRVQQRQLQVTATKRRHDERQQCASRPAVRRLEREARDEGLQTALPANNKGFAMLARMGYKAGDSLGRSSSAGIVQPIGIEIKTDRGGLGRAVALQQLQDRRAELRRQKLLQMAARSGGAQVSTEDFRRRMTQKAQERQLEADLGKSQRACEKLDLKEHIETPAMPWFWPLRPVAQPDDEEDGAGKPPTQAEDDESEEGEDDVEPAEKLDMLSAYLRTTYCYCHWCGTQFEDGDDLKANCPGETKDDH